MVASIYLFICASICLSIYPSMSVSPPVCLSVCLTNWLCWSLSHCLHFSPHLYSPLALTCLSPFLSFSLLLPLLVWAQLPLCLLPVCLNPCHVSIQLTFSWLKKSMLLLLLSVLAKRMKSPPSLLLYWGSSFVSQTSSLKKGVSCHVAISFWTGV